MTPCDGFSEARLYELVEHLARDPAMAADCVRIRRCQEQRCAEDRPMWPYRCRHVACRSCRPCAGRTWRRAAREAFREADHGACMMVTVLLCRSGDLDAMRDVLDRFRIDLRNLRDRLSRRDPRWGSICVRGQIEIDAIHEEIWQDVPRERRAVIDALPCHAYAGDVTWLPHAHLCLHAPELFRADIMDALSKQWPGKGRVHVRALDPAQSSGEALSRIVSYSAKHKSSNKLLAIDADGCWQWHYELWPVEIQSAYWSWIKSMRRGLSPLRLKLNPKKQRSEPVEIDLKHVEQVPVCDAWTGVPLPYLL